MKLDYFEILVCLATIAVLVLITAAGIGMVADYSRVVPSTNIGSVDAGSLPAGAAPASADQASRRLVDDLLAMVDLCRCDMRARAQRSSSLRVSTPAPPFSEQGIECPIDAEQHCI
jgi:hypothetical protein